MTCKRLKIQRWSLTLLGSGLACLLIWWLLNPLNWWLPRDKSTRSRGTTIGWLDPGAEPDAGAAVRIVDLS